MTVATVNTYFAQALRRHGGIDAILPCDIIAFQELYDPSPEDERRISQLGFELVAVHGATGLGIAIRSEAHIVCKTQSIRQVILQSAGKLGVVGACRIAGRATEYTGHGILAAKFAVGNVHFTLAVAHAPIVMAPWKRKPYIDALTTELADSYYDGPLIVVGDMNHYPGPHAIDAKFCKTIGLSYVAYPRATWPSRNAKVYERAIGLLRPGILDVILYREFEEPSAVSTIDVMSDHCATRATFRCF